MREHRTRVSTQQKHVYSAATLRLLRSEARLRGFVISALCTLLALVIFPGLIFYAVRIGYGVPIDYNEGWNVIHTWRLLNGEPLYLPSDTLPVIPVNYPPLSFFIIGAANYLGGNLLVLGRIFSFAGMLLVAFFVYRIVADISANRFCGMLSALVWLVFIIHTADLFVGMDDPQMLAHVFSTCALYAAVVCANDIKTKHTWVIAASCCVALFTKHLLVAVPTTIAITFLLASRQLFWRFAAAGAICFGVMFLGSWLYGGEYLFSNFIDFERPASNWRRAEMILDVFFKQSGWVLFVPFVILLLGASNRMMHRIKWQLITGYFCLSFGFGAFFSGGVDVSLNAWFDFFIAAAILFGLLAANKFAELRMLERPALSGMASLAMGLLVAGGGLLVTGNGALGAPEEVTLYSLRSLQLFLLGAGSMLLIYERFALLLGTVLIIAAVIGNEAVLARYISLDGNLELSTIYAVRWFQISLLTSGLILVGRRPILAAVQNLLGRRAAGLLSMKLVGTRWVHSLLVLGFVPVIIGVALKLSERWNYRNLELVAKAYEQDVAVLRSIEGPALFENLLLGFDAGKNLLFDPFSGSVLMASGRLPEEILIEPIAQKYFAVIVTTSKLEERVAEQRSRAVHSVRPAAYFNGNIIEAIEENYQLLGAREALDANTDGQKLKTLDGKADYGAFFYVPRTEKMG